MAAHKQGQGLSPQRNCAYTGPTRVTAGRPSAHRTVTGPVTVPGRRHPGAWHLVCSDHYNTLSLAGTTVMELDAAAGTNDQVLG